MAGHGADTGTLQESRELRNLSKKSRYTSTANTPRSESAESAKMETPGWKHLFGFMTAKHLLFLLPAILCSAISGAVFPVISYLIGKLFSKFTAFGSGELDSSELKEQTTKYVLYTIIVGAGGWLVNALAFMMWHIFAGLQGRCARQLVFNAMLLGPVEWYDRRKDGVKALSTILQSHINDLQVSTGQPMSLVCQYLTTIFGSFGLAFYLSWRLTLVILAGVPVAVFIVPFLVSRLTRSILLQTEKLGEAAKIVANALSFIEAVKCNNGEKQELQSYASVINDAAHFFNRQVFWASLQASILRLVSLSMFVQGFWFGTVMLNRGQITASQILTAFYGAILATQFLMQLGPFLVMLEKGKVAGQKLRAAIRQMERLNSDFGGLTPDRCVGDILFEQVSFSYPSRPEIKALRGANLFFAAGEISYVVGDSGSGKSTLGQLLLKFYNPSSGVVKLDGQSIHTLNTEYVREHVLLVEQESSLFTGTILENIYFGKRKGAAVPSVRIYEAAKFAQIGNVIAKLPRGFKTQVGIKGTSLSGGQRQRIALARARIRDPTVLILDESTSALDYVNRAAVLDSIRSWRKGKTTIIITHDIHQILPDEFVYVMENGTVIQEGFRGTLEKDLGSKFHEFLLATKDKLESLPKAQHDAELEDPLDSSPSVTITKGNRGSDLNDFLDFYLDNNEPTSATLPILALFNKDKTLSNQPRPMQITPMLTPFSRLAPARPPSFDWASIRTASTTSLLEEEEEETETLGTFDAIVPKWVRSLFKQDSKPRSDYHMRQTSSSTSNRIKSISGSSINLTDVSQYFKNGRRSKKSNAAKTVSLHAILKTIWPQLHGTQKLNLLFATLGSTVYAVSTPMFSYVFSKLLSTFYIATNREHLATQYSLGIFAIAIVDAAAIFVKQTQLGRCGQSWANNMRCLALERLLAQPRQFFSEPENGVSRLSECLDQHAEEMQNIIGRFLGLVYVSFVMVLVALTWSLVSCWKLTLILVACFPVIYGIMFVMQTVSGEMDRRQLGAEEVTGAIFNETLTNIKTIRSLTLEDRFRKRFQKASDQALRASIRRSIFCAPIFGLSENILFFLNAIIFYYGAMLVYSGDFGLQDIIETFVLLIFSISNASAMLAVMPQMSVSKEAASRVLRLTTLPAESHENAGQVRIAAAGDVQIRNVTFSYPSRPEDSVLRNMSLSVPTGSCMAIVGLSGSGKSTIASLLVNLYPLTNITSSTSVDMGITFSGHPIQQIHTPSLRSLVALVPQTPVVFSGTVIANIAYGLPEFSPLRARGNIRAAAEAAGAHAFIVSLPQGYDTLIGEGGTGLSGGQAQRLALARTLVRRPNVLILDEVTSALDSSNAAIVRETIRALLKADKEGTAEVKRKLTVLIITHSREMMRVADTICMLDGGRVVEMGTYDNLMGSRDSFSKLISGEVWENDDKP